MLRWTGYFSNCKIELDAPLPRIEVEIAIAVAVAGRILSRLCQEVCVLWVYLLLSCACARDAGLFRAVLNVKIHPEAAKMCSFKDEGVKRGGKNQTSLRRLCKFQGKLVLTRNGGQGGLWGLGGGGRAS